MWTLFFLSRFAVFCLLLGLFPFVCPSGKCFVDFHSFPFQVVHVSSYLFVMKIWIVGTLSTDPRYGNIQMRRILFECQGVRNELSQLYC